MFLDLRDQWPPVPPRAPMPETGKPQTARPRERLLGLVVVINIGLVLIALAGSGALIQAITTLFAMFPD
jgi:hypothetical protein